MRHGGVFLMRGKTRRTTTQVDVPLIAGQAFISHLLLYVLVAVTFTYLVLTSRDAIVCPRGCEYNF